MTMFLKSIVRYCTKINIILVLGSVLVSNSVFAITPAKLPFMHASSPLGAVHTLPYILMRSASDGSWKMVTKYTLPTDIDSAAILNGVVCQGAKCVASGLYNGVNFYERPLIMTSADGGTSWASVSSNKIQYNTQNVNYLYIDGPSCNTAMCIVTGTYGIGAIDYPLILKNVAGSDTWTMINQSNISLPSDYVISKDVSIEASNCSGNLCIATGYYGSASSNTNPLILMSTDLGAHWTAIDKSRISFPKDYQSTGDLFAVNCNGMSCTATGYYVDSSSNDRPLIFNSDNGGQTWTGVDPGNVILPNNFHSGDLAANFCDKTGCKAIGNYVPSPGAAISPLLLTTDTNKINWDAVPHANLILPKDYISGDDGNALSCNTAFCVAIGRYYDVKQNYHALILVSNSKNIWQSVDEAKIQPPIPGSLNTYLSENGLTFNGATFVAVGYYYNDTPIS